MRTVLGIVIAIIIVAGGLFLWSSMQQATPTPAPANTATTTPTVTTVPTPIIGNNEALGTNNSPTLGTYLIGYNDRTVYTYDKDSMGTSTCYGACATNWPPYIVSSSDNINNIGAGISGTTGVITRTDGTLQLTYNGMPLYFFVGDMGNNDTTGQNVGGFTVVKA